MAGILRDDELRLNISRLANGPKVNTPTPNRGGGAVRSVARPSNPRLQKLMSVPDTVSAPKKDDDGGLDWGDIGDVAKAAVMKPLELADAGRRLYQGVAGEVGDVVEGLPGNTPVEYLANTLAGNPFQLRGLADEEGNRDTNFDIGEIRRSVTGDDAMMNGFLGRTTWDDSMPKALRPIVGFAGDIATDPLTYLTAGTASTALRGAKAGAGAARTSLAMNVAGAVDDAIEAGGKVISKEVGDKIVREAGKRGRGAFTEQGLKRMGPEAEALAKELDLVPDFGYSVGVGNARMNIAGSRRLAESSENLKGAVKAMTGSSGAGRIAREIFTSAKWGEKDFKQQLLSGSTNAADAARGLALVNAAKGQTFEWLDSVMRSAERLNVGDTKFSGMDEPSRRALTLAVDAGDFNHPLAKEMSDWFREVGTDLQQKFGVQFELTDNYMPRRLSKKAKALYESGDNNPIWAQIMDPTMKKEQAFQKVRQTGDETISQMNARWRAEGHDFDLFETDAHVLIGQYLGEAQHAAMRGVLTGDQAQRAGLVDAMDKVLSDKKVKKTLKGLEQEASDAIVKAGERRAKGLRRASSAVRSRRQELSSQIDAVKKASGAADSAATRAEQTYNKSAARLAQLETELKQVAGEAAQAKGVEKGRLTVRLKELAGEQDAMRRQLTTAKTRLTKAQFERGRLRDELRTAQAEWDTIQGTVRSLEGERAAMDAAPVTNDPSPFSKKTQTKIAKAETAEGVAQAQRDVVAKAQTDYGVAANTAAWAKADAIHVKDTVSQEIQKLDTWMDGNRGLKRGKAGSVERKAYNDTLRDQLKVVRGLLDSDDPVVEWLAKQEAQSLVSDAKAWRAGRDADRIKTLAEQYKQGMDVLSNPRLQDMIVATTRDGWSTLPRRTGDDMQIKTWYDEAIQKMDRFSDPRTKGPAWRAAKKTLDAYRTGLNWWKGWALASPGFVSRNLQTGLFAMYLDDVNPAVATRFWSFLRKTQTVGDDKAMAWAEAKYGKEMADNLMKARQVAAASGWGQTQAEFTKTLAGNKGRFNPVSANNAAVKGIRSLSEESESFLRGGHAFAVLQKGGTYNDALERVQKFHFNYRDISEFDRNAKLVMPFWTFWSRNLGLQAQVFAKRPDKITRSYFNAKRNIEEGAPEYGEAIPDYILGDMAGIRTPFGKPDGTGQLYVTPDIPSARFPAQLEGMINNPLNEAIGLMGPGFKVPVELLLNKDTFLDKPYRNSLEQMGENGTEPREAPWYMQLPGIKEGISALPGADIYGDKLLIQDNVEAALKNVNPMLQRSESLFTQGWTPRTAQAWSSFAVGAPIRFNDERSQAGAEAAQRREAQAAADKIQERIRLERLVSGG